jgi:heme-degrading monooxygenase HmoA
MFVTVHNYKIGEGTQLDVARSAQGFLEMVSAIPGFRAYYMIDEGDHRIGSVSIFDTAEGVQECDRRAAEFVTDRLGGFQLSDVETTEGKVLASQLSR